MTQFIDKQHMDNRYHSGKNHQNIANTTATTTEDRKKYTIIPS